MEASSPRSISDELADSVQSPPKRLCLCQPCRENDVGEIHRMTAWYHENRSANRLQDREVDVDVDWNDAATLSPERSEFEAKLIAYDQLLQAQRAMPQLLDEDSSSTDGDDSDQEEEEENHLENFAQQVIALLADNLMTQKGATGMLKAFRQYLTKTSAPDDDMEMGLSFPTTLYMIKKLAVLEQNSPERQKGSQLLDICPNLECETGSTI